MEVDHSVQTAQSPPFLPKDSGFNALRPPHVSSSSRRFRSFVPDGAPHVRARRGRSSARPATDLQLSAAGTLVRQYHGRPRYLRSARTSACSTAALLSRLGRRLPRGSAAGISPDRGGLPTA